MALPGNLQVGVNDLAGFGRGIPLVADQVFDRKLVSGLIIGQLIRPAI